MTVEERAREICKRWYTPTGETPYRSLEESVTDGIQAAVAEHNEQCAMVADRWNSVAAAHISSDIRALLTPSVDQQAKDADESQESQQQQTRNSPQ